MKVLMIASVPENLQEIKGGVEAVTVNLLSGFAKLDTAIYVLSFNKELNKEKKVKYSENIIIHYKPYMLFNNEFIHLLIGHKIVKRIYNFYKPDIVHIQATGLNLFKSIGLNKDKVVLTQHGISWKEVNSFSGIKKFKLFLHKIADNLFLKKFSNIIFISEYNKNLYLAKFCELPINNQLIYNPVNPIFFQVYNKKKQSNTILYIGGIHERKGLIVLLKAIKRLNLLNKKYKVFVVGDFVNRAYKKEIITFINKNNIKKQIYFMGWKQQSDIITIMEKSSIFILPSYQETLPVTIAEAMSAGLLVVATRVGGIPEMVEDKKEGFLFEKGNVIELKNILEKLYNNKDALNNTVISSKLKAYNMFSSDKIAQATLTYYEKIIIKNNDK